MDASGILLLQEASLWSSFDATVLLPEHETVAQLLLASSPNVPDQSDQSFSLPLVPWSSDAALDSCFSFLENDNSSSLIHMTSQFDHDLSCLSNGEKSSNNIGDWIINLPENVATDQQQQTLKPQRKHSASKDDISSKCSKKARVLVNGPGGRKRADEEPSTKSQSLYAKERRERINKRIRILQNLVPNGSKVDISTMLEEAADYVKFLQLQIEMLSSDELWMYAPIAYNGINVGLGLKIPPLKKQQ